jgi:hypothetical protein
MHSHSFCGVVHQCDHSVAECGLVARERGGVGDLSVYITQYSGRSACFPMATETFWCPRMSSKAVFNRLAAVSTRSLPLMFVCPHTYVVLWEGPD